MTLAALSVLVAQLGPDWRAGRVLRDPQQPLVLWVVGPDPASLTSPELERLAERGVAWDLLLELWRVELLPTSPGGEA
jgi:hypothetical protein